MEGSLPVCTLVVNPTAGRGRAGRVLPQVITVLAEALPGHQLDVQQTTSYEHARRLCQEAVSRAAPTSSAGSSPSAAGSTLSTAGSESSHGPVLVVMGGDGMLHLGVDACAGTDVRLGLLPAGTGNDMCRGFGLDVHGPLPAVRGLAAGRVRRFDALRVGGDLDGGRSGAWVGSVVATGFDARVNRRANEMARPRGSLRYAVAALAELATFRPLRYSLALDGRHRELSAMFVAVGNGGYFGGGMNICPDADPADGLLDVTIVHPVRRATLLALLPLMFSGAFVAHPCVERTTAHRVDLDGAGADGRGLFAMGDGELLGPTPVRLEAVPGALTVLG